MTGGADLVLDYGRRQALAVVLSRYREMTFPHITREEAAEHTIAAFILIQVVRHLLGFNCRWLRDGRSSILESGVAL